MTLSSGGSWPGRVDDAEALRLAAALVRGEAEPWPFGADETTVERWLDLVRWHGVAPLLADRMKSCEGVDVWPTAVRRALEAEWRGAAVVEDRSRAEVAAVLDALAGAGIPALVFKGTALAYTVYPRPWLRPRVDTDILVDPDRRDEARRVLEVRGYRRTPLIDGSVVMRQAEYVRSDGGGVRHAIDLHWRAGNAPILAGLAAFDELRARAIHVDALGDSARVLHPVDALHLACVHRVTHHPTTPRLIWLYDVDRLANTFENDEVETLVERIVSTRTARLVAGTLAEASAVFKSPRTAEVARRTARLAGAASAEPSACYLRPPACRAAGLLRDARLFGSWRESGRFLLQHLFPSRAYMQAAYGVSHPAVLPWLYGYRLSTGVWRWLRRS